MTDINKALGKVAYEAYFEYWRDKIYHFNLPPWDHQTAATCEAWEAAADAVVTTISKEDKKEN